MGQLGTAQSARTHSFQSRILPTGCKVISECPRARTHHTDPKGAQPARPVTELCPRAAVKAKIIGYSSLTPEHPAGSPPSSGRDCTPLGCMYFCFATTNVRMAHSRGSEVKTSPAHTWHGDIFSLLSTEDVIIEDVTFIHLCSSSCISDPVTIKKTDLQDVHSSTLAQGYFAGRAYWEWEETIGRIVGELSPRALADHSCRPSLCMRRTCLPAWDCHSRHK
jgi:hypothetical protein